MKYSIKVKTYLLYALAILMTGISVYIVVRKIDETSRKTQSTNASVSDLTHAVSDLKSDNGQQTIILCTLILGQNVSITGDDAAKIEAICRQKIQQTGVDKALSGPASVSAQHQDNPPSSSSSSKNTPLVSPPQPDNSHSSTQPPNDTPPTPPHSILPMVKNPILGCVTKTICI